METAAQGVTRALSEEGRGFGQEEERVTVPTRGGLDHGEAQDGFSLKRGVIFDERGGTFQHRPRLVICALPPVAERKVCARPQPGWTPLTSQKARRSH